MLSSSPNSSRMLPVCACSSGLRANRGRAGQGKVWVGGVALISRAVTRSLLFVDW